MSHFDEAAPVLQDDCVPPVLEGLFREFFESTWYAMEGTTTLTWTR